MLGLRGWRVGAWEYLKWGHFTPIYKDQSGDGKEKLVACRVLIYAGEDEQYYTFVTPEAYRVTKDWMDLRERSGESINRDSWVMREFWNDRIRKGGNHRGARIDAPRILSLQGIETQLNRAWATQGVRGKLGDGSGRRRHAFSQAHVFRKYFKTMAEGAGMKSINVETLMGHSIGVSDSYYHPREDDLLQDYIQAIPALTFESYTANADEVALLKAKDALNSDAIATLMAELEKQKQELELLKVENARLRNLPGPSIGHELEQMQGRLDELRKMVGRE